MKVQKLENRTNEFTEQLTILLSKPFVNSEKFYFNYYLGKNYKEIKGLYFDLYSEDYGTFYNKHVDLKSYEIIADKEDEFISSIINDILFHGISFLSFIKKQSLNERSKTDIKIFLN